jgi:hypothetical protein
MFGKGDVGRELAGHPGIAHGKPIRVQTSGTLSHHFGITDGGAPARRYGASSSCNTSQRTTKALRPCICAKTSLLRRILIYGRLLSTNRESPHGSDHPAIRLSDGTPRYLTGARYRRGRLADRHPLVGRRFPRPRRSVATLVPGNGRRRCPRCGLLGGSADGRPSCASPGGR